MNEITEIEEDDIDNIFNDNENVANVENVNEEEDEENFTDPRNSYKANQKFMDYEDIGNKTLEDKVYSVIKTIYDPEIPVNIYELGLIYDVSITKNNEAVVLMTLTTPNCPVAGGLPREVEDKIKEHPEITDAKVILTFDPSWDMSMMSEEAKFELGML
jgi:FeS assembly SUF system protein